MRKALLHACGGTRRGANTIHAAGSGLGAGGGNSIRNDDAARSLLVRLLDCKFYVLQTDFVRFRFRKYFATPEPGMFAAARCRPQIV